MSPSYSRKNSLVSTASLYKISFSQIDAAQKHLDDCEAAVSPGLANLSRKVSAARTHLQRLEEDEISGEKREPNSRPPSVVKFLKLSSKPKDANFEDIYDIHEMYKVCTKLLQQTTTLSSRRQDYLGLFRIISSHRLPEENPVSLNALSSSQEFQLQSLIAEDDVEIDKNVMIKEGSYLDCTKYQTSGPKLITLAQKTIKVMIFAQREQFKAYRRKLTELCTHLHYYVMEIALDMRTAPDDADCHLRYMKNVERIIDYICGEWIGTNVLNEYQQHIHQQEESFKSHRLNRPDRQRTNGISETRDEVVLIVHGEKHIHAKVNLTWEYLQERVFPPLGITVFEVTDIRDADSNGSFAYVYSARLPDGKMVALKRPWYESSDVLCLRFIRELYIWWKAGNHPNINTLSGICFIDGIETPAMVSSWCNDGNLFEYIRSNPALTRNERLELAFQAAQGLQHLHSYGIVHGDLKPNNILIQDGQAKLHDFGTSRISSDALGLSTRPHGCFRYQAPEVLEEQYESEAPRSCASAESDIFSFGYILYECLTRRRPFHKLGSRFEIIQALKDGKRPTSPGFGDEVVGECKEELIRLMKDCWHEDTSPRPSADYVVEKLKQIKTNIAFADAAR